MGLDELNFMDYIFLFISLSFSLIGLQTIISKKRKFYIGIQGSIDSLIRYFFKKKYTVSGKEAIKVGYIYLFIALIFLVISLRRFLN